MKLSPEEAKEIAKHVERGRSDFPYFCKSMLGIDLHEGQLGAWDKTKKKYVRTNIYLCGNRGGKTVYISCKHIWKLYYKIAGPGKEIKPAYWEDLEYRTLNAAPHSNQTKIMLKTIMRIIRGKFPLRHPDGTITTNLSLIRYFIDDDALSNPEEPPKAGPYELHFANGSSFFAFTLGGSHGDAIQGEAYAYASYDEFGRSKDPDKEHDDITTRLGDWVGELDIITTPDENNPDASDWLADKVDRAAEPNSGFRYIHWDTTANPHMTQDSLNTILIGKTEEQKRRILKGSIMKTSLRYFPYRKVNAMFDHDCKQHIDFLNRFPSTDRKYFGGLDTSGMGKDMWAFYVIDYTEKPWKVVFRFVSKDTPVNNMRETRQIIDQFMGCDFKWQIDFTSEGGTIIYDSMRDLMPIPYRFSIEKGTGRNMKVELTDTLRRIVQDEILWSPEDNSLHSQLAGYRGPKEDKGQATDCVMALGLACYLPFQELIKPKRQWIYDVGDLDD